jgi:uncharacterized protein YcbK (DUF882 family)
VALAAGGGTLTHLTRAGGGHVTVKVAHGNSLQSSLTRLGYCSSVAALLIFFGCDSLQSASAEGETRTLSLHHMHTSENLTITYKVNGRYDENALAKLNTLLRDWREEKATAMDPHLLDLLWEVHRAVGAKEPVWVVCGYRSPSTNSMLRRRSSGVAQFSQHMNGKAIDFYIPGVPLGELRAAGLRAQRGGVGFYPSSGAPFVHLDTGNVRHWPRMPEAQLASLLAKGPLSSRSASDARGTAFAQGDIARPIRKPSLLAKLFGNGKDADEEADAAAASNPSPAAKAAEAVRTAKIETKAEKPVGSAASGSKPVPLPLARPLKPESYQVASASATSVAMPTAGRSGSDRELAMASSNAPLGAADYELTSALFKPVRLAQATTLSDSGNATANDVIAERGFWQGVPKAEPVEVPPATNSRVSASPASPPPAAPANAAARRAVATASAGPALPAKPAPWPLADRKDPEPFQNALSYAAQPDPMATRTLQATPSKPQVSAHGDTTVAVKHSDERAPAAAPKREAAISPAIPAATPTITSRKPSTSVVRVGDRFNDPWMRAMIVTPSTQDYMETTLFGAPDFRNLGPYLEKPTTAVAVAFTDDSHPGMATDRFAGNPVTFVSTVPFGTSRTATR